MITKITDEDIRKGALKFSSEEEAREYLRQATPLRSTNYPTVHGTEEVRKLLVQRDPSAVACWIKGTTVYGDVHLVSQNWGTYSVPIFAYLELVPPVKILPAGATREETWSGTKGYTQGFTTTMTHSFGVSAAIDIVNISSDIEIGFEASVTWNWSQTYEITESLEGPNDFYEYQVAIVYAQLATSAGPLGSQVTELYRALTSGSRVDLAFLCSVATRDEVTTNKDLNALTWREVQNYLLKDHWGTWGWDFTAYDDPKRRY